MLNSFGGFVNLEILPSLRSFLEFGLCYLYPLTVSELNLSNVGPANTSIQADGVTLVEIMMHITHQKAVFFGSLFPIKTMYSVYVSHSFWSLIV